MSDASNFILLGSFVLFCIGIIPYLIWVVVTLAKKRWRTFGILLLGPAILIVLVVGTIRVLDAFAYRAYLKGVYGTKCSLPDPIFEFHSPRDFNGDGYSFEVMELPAEIRARFESADDELLSGFPKRPNYRNDWEVSSWREAPAGDELEGKLDFALSDYGVGRDPDLVRYFGLIREALDRKGTFYASFTKEGLSSPINIDFFVVDLVGGWLYQINHNT
ncbi:MAG: hypothetical protein KDN18_08730, partial [Verrucomicrobiae bacterium]|nr:hypothetical protein [Verrucomicrobiae bacterium]